MRKPNIVNRDQIDLTDEEIHDLSYEVPKNRKPPLHCGYFISKWNFDDYVCILFNGRYCWIPLWQLKDFGGNYR